MPNTIPAIYRGSEWRKWDLHVHSPASAGYAGTWEQFEQQIKSADCAVIGINDYLSVEGYGRLKDRINKNLLDIGQTRILPVVEFRMRDVLKNKHTGKSGTSINFHVIFSDEIDIEIIECFLKSIEIEGKQIANNYCDPNFLKNTAKVYFENDIIKPLKNNPDFRGKVIVWLPYDEYGGIDDIDPITDDWIKCDFVKKSDVLGSSNTNQIDFFLWKYPCEKNGKNRYSNEDYKNWFEKKKPCVKGSDSHDHKYPIGKLKDQKSKPVEKYCWIKADPTFEGLKQIIYEPEQRIKIQELKPEEKFDFNIIDRIEYSNPSTKERQVVFFNQNLNSLIGSRAMGKSNLLKNIAFAIDPEQCKEKGIKRQDYLPLKDFKVFWKDGKENALITSEEKNKGILFIPQKYLGELVYEGTKEFDTFLSKLFTNKEVFDNRIQEYKKLEDDNFLKITALIRELLALFEEEKEKRNRMKKIGNKADIENEIINIEKKLEDINKTGKTITREELTAYKELKAEKVNTTNTIALISQDISSLQFLKEEEIITAEKVLEFDISPERLEKIVKKLKETDDKFKKEYIAIEISALEDKKTEIEKDSLNIEKKLTPLKIKIEKHKALVDLTKALEETREKLSFITIIEKELNEIQTKCLEKQGDIVSKYFIFFERYENISLDIKDLEFSVVDITITFETTFFISFIDENINYHNSVLFKKEKQKYKEANHLLSNPSVWSYNEEQFTNILSQLLEGIISGELLLKTGKDVESVLIGLFKNRFKIDYQKSIKNKKGEDFKHMSDGEKALTLLEFIFKFDDYNYPVILDQPEDDLDTRAISKHIVQFLKDEKTKRQIIIASHNANLVVCGDSEGIIVSSKSGGKSPAFKYHLGAIENPNIRNEIIEILEGGKDALEIRRGKLNLS